MAHSPNYTLHDLTPPEDAHLVTRRFFLSLPEEEKSKIYNLYKDARVFDKWFSGLSKKAKKEEYAWLLLDGRGKKISKTKFQIVEDKALRIRMVRKIEKLKKDGKLEANYKLK